MAKSRLQLRQERMRRRLADADTPQKRLNAAFDWMRSSAEYLGKRGARVERGHGPGYPAAVAVMAEVTEYLAGHAEEIDRSLGRYPA